ncbi:MAG: DinB family protein, partial [Runella slithyformis]
QTTLSRELVYIAEHAIHHLAILKIALRAHFPDIALPVHFGVAYSTVQYQNSIQN